MNRESKIVSMLRLQFLGCAYVVMGIFACQDNLGVFVEVTRAYLPAANLLTIGMRLICLTHDKEAFFGLESIVTVECRERQFV